MSAQLEQISSTALAPAQRAAIASASRKQEALTQVALQAAVHYDPETGIFTRLTGGRGFSAKTKFGYTRQDGYRACAMMGSKFMLHRLAWLYVYGRWPTSLVDHIDGDRANNRISNLREATNAENLQNQSQAQRSNKTSGILGVSWNKKLSKWVAQISRNGTNTYLGIFESTDEAHAAYLSAKKAFHPFAQISSTVTGDAR